MGTFMLLLQTLLLSPVKVTLVCVLPNVSVVRISQKLCRGNEGKQKASLQCAVSRGAVGLSSV